MDDAVASASHADPQYGTSALPVTIRHGELDQLCLVEHGRWLAGRIPGAMAHILPDHGHTSITAPLDEVMDELMRASR